ncbi:glycoside hydrolase family 43 protein [Echinimonas agarilytica]|uniref:Glycoside hydrolase family 43 protein n=1 Tax=Echinimonas agarilytica TaxID=1215918 RepID=A0AA41W7B9_9GAMM|nr:glycoside hydrolase family 43 protein [Echinimonas agarilytica]MCM2680490.1 glycoside hydrolase family 43 protein [Echinimonas agarilytica]
MSLIKNPVIRGFNPDPSICRVGDDYYIVTSTFEWFPGIQIHHSKDLVNWRLLTRALDTVELLDMRGMDNSEGVYAPTLSYADGRFWLCFSNTHACRGGSWMATPCFVVTAESIEGPWSDPISIGNYGFDPSMFHDDDGKKYMVNMIWDGRKNTNYFGGIVLQEFDANNGTLTGPIKNIFKGTELGCTEGPQILKKDGYYYLVTAEGGTEFDHAVTVCRSKSVWGPYEVHPNNPMLTSRFKENARLQRAGHGFFFETQNGEWYMTHLCSRPLKNPEGYQFAPQYGSGRSILGRESAIQQVSWVDGWPELAQGGNTPFEEVQAPDLADCPWPTERAQDHFDEPNINLHYQSLREPFDNSWMSLTERPGFLRLVGRHYLYSRYEQSLVARRLQSFYASAETAMEFNPMSPLQMAGLVVYYAKGSHYFLKQTLNDNGATILQIVQFQDDIYDEYDEVEIEHLGRVYLKVDLEKVWYQFSYSVDGDSWHKIGPQLNSTPMSDEGGPDVFRFTGTLVGLFAADISGQALHADFDYFDYQELPDPDWD